MNLHRSIDLTQRGDFMEREFVEDGLASPFFWVPRQHRFTPGDGLVSKSPFFSSSFLDNLKPRTRRESIFFRDNAHIERMMQVCARCGGPIKMLLESFHSEQPYNFFVCQPCEEDMNEEFQFPSYIR